ncbi:piezo-type mechanosensitive ion channel component isoform X2 [Phymastichus coffea]|uniref:piezo-type mechanosensitive ion channel component isoform X2 n=1 Tax=Phymastichus coffea TaxID=108790 RepID=UPI00273C0C0A|nr:piezo-type mechanosensitive ion channel component isoform X2 [Phymastichus coffea]
MTKYWLNTALMRIVYPSLLIACTIWRPVGLSLVYLTLALLSPMIPVPTTTSMKSHTGRFLKTCVALSLIVAVAQIAFHVVLLALSPSGEILEYCKFPETLLRHIGFVRLDGASVWEVFFWLTPEILVFPSSVAVYVLCRKLVSPQPREDEDNASLQRQQKSSKERSSKIINFLGGIGTYAVLAALCCAASLKPSVEGAFYFLVFIGSATWWACHRELGRGFAFLCRMVMAVVALHITLLLFYQNQWPQDKLPANETWARYFGFVAVYQTHCDDSGTVDPRDVHYVNTADWSTYAYSLRLFLLYFLLALQSKFLFKKPANQRARLSGRLENLDTPLSRHVSIRKRTPSQRWQSARRKARLMRFGSGRTGLLQDSTGSVIVQDGQQEDSIQLQSLSEEDQPGIMEHIVMAVFSIFQLVVNSSYLATNIIMMTWSIMYHSWTTFALLLWALILWMVPNKRSSMMKCSPFIVLYCTILVLIQYVYSMDLTEAELPTKIYGIEMSDIGFLKQDKLSCWHLVVKCLFMTMFWITMRQYTAEKMRQRRSSALRDMVAPLHVSVSTATTAMNNQIEPEIKSKFMKDVGVVVKRLLTRFWIAIVAIMLFTSGITGERMTLFRIIYMSLFLIFIVSFQLSWKVWRKMMYGFWITVIAYSVIMLILVYTFQFPTISRYWQDYLYVTPELQSDIGLIKYEQNNLFVGLLPPTFFVIITVLQIHYFHDDFLEITNIDRVSETSRKDSLGHSPSTAPIVSPTEIFASERDEEHHIFTLKELKRMSKLERIALIRKLSTHLYNFYNHVWLFMEVHMQKIIFISIALMCIGDVCAINFFFMLTVAVGINFRRSLQIVVINFMAMTIAVLMVIKMLYQIEYIHHHRYDTNCTDTNGTSNSTWKGNNTAAWIGFSKTANATENDSVEPTLPKLLEGYIGIITVTTLRAIIAVRQSFHRQENGEPLETPSVMFPKIKRADADKGIVSCIKFLFNYGFYKFGLEFCLMGTVALIGIRLDFYSLLYSIWLMILFSMNRKTVAKVWPFLKVFAVVLLPLQYAFAVGLPPWLCIGYPWSETSDQPNKSLIGLRDWMFLPGTTFDTQPNVKKLICDVILLIMIVRQSLVFRIEQRSDTTGQEYAGGHNYSVCKDMEKPNFINPVRDYVSQIHNWLDVFKRGSMMSLMWLTLSIMFLAGTKRNNLFSLGYLIGAFVFLWQGSDFYLRPVKTILKWWNILIGYNIFVIFCKTIFQGIGCVLIEKLVDHCRIIQLLGIGCLDKFESQFTSGEKCHVDREDVGMVWDGLCFGFLLIQKRLFRSYYFFHIVDETKAMSILASRGAELLEEFHQKRIAEQEEIERAGLQKIKFKMDKIKANQRKIQGQGYKEPKTHHIGEAPLARTSSMSSCISSTRTPPQGYQTPIDDDDDDGDGGGARGEDDALPLTPAASLLQAPSPNSAIMTVGLEGYLEPARISFGSPPSSELNPRGPSPDDTFPVFSPPPRDTYRQNEDVRRRHRRQSSVADSSWATHAPRTSRRSIISTTSRSHHTSIRSGDYYMFDDMDDDDLTDLFPEKDISEEENRRREREQRTRRMTVSELMNTLIKTDIEIATHVALYGGTHKDALKMRRRSVPLTRKKSSMSYLSARSDTDTAAATDLPEQVTTSSGDEDPTEREIDGELDKTSEKDSVGSKMKDAKDTKISLLTYFKFSWAFINSTMVSLTKYLNRYSNDYRYVRKVLAKEKRLLKAKPDFRMGTRLGISQIWQPLPIVKQRLTANGNSDDVIEDPGEGPSNRDDNSGKSSLFSHTLRPRSENEDEELLSEINQPPIIQLAASIWFGILAHSMFLCYFMVFLHQIKNASFLSTPLPLMVFLWGSLTIPRPSKTFWVTIIAYVEIIVIIKCMCQSNVLPWNDKELTSNPFEVPRILGVEKKINYALWDLLLLLVVFFHRFMLKSLGQWTSPSLKSRKVISTGLTLATIHQQPNRTDEDKVAQKPATTEAEKTNATANEITTPEGKTLSLQLHDGTDNENNSPLPPIGDNEQLIVIQATERNLIEEDFQKAMRLTIMKYFEPLKILFNNILDPSGKEKTNVYAYMFLCDFFNFILLIFGFSAFGAQQGDGGVAQYFAENRVPMPFLLMLLLQFALIVIDRALFLKKSLKGKLVFQYFLVVGVHVWMFIILPSATERAFNTKVIPQIWYMVKCFYLLLAAYQLRLGYPTRILGNFLCKKYTIVNYTLFKGFMVVPLLFEMRAVMDWIWTDTSMTLMDWFKMEDIFANIYQIKCMRGLESDYPQERGVKKAQISKYMVGGGALIVMIGMIWFPLLLFALGSTVGTSNLPTEVTLNIRIGSYEPIYTIAAQNSSIVRFNERNFNKLRELYEMTHRDRPAVTFLENYINTDVVVVRLSPQSGKLWTISPPDKARLKEELLANDTVVTVYVEWTVERKPASKDLSGITSKVHDFALQPFVNGVKNPVRQAIVDALNGVGFAPSPSITIVATESDNSTEVSLSNKTTTKPLANNTSGVLLSNALPLFLKVTSNSVSVVPQLMKPLLKSKIDIDDEDDESKSYLYRDISLVVANNSINQQWFTIHENCNDSVADTLVVPLMDCSFISMYMFNDKMFPESLSFISGLGIFGLYTTAVILFSSFIKKMVSDMAPKIMFEDLPYVDRILRLCLDIYLVRESGDLCLEEDLFAKLVFLYRSPETLIRWTRPPEPGEQTDGEDDDQNYNEIDDDGLADRDDGQESQLRRLPVGRHVE